MSQVVEKTIWFITGSQHLYGEGPLRIVNEHSAEIAAVLDKIPGISVRIVAKPVLTRAEDIRRCLLEATADDSVVGVITWMHTFSPAKMWIAGLLALQKPLLQLHTQYNKELPWSTIDMDFMNLNQAAHGDREFGHIVTRLGIPRRVVVGHWSTEKVQTQVKDWAAVAFANAESRQTKVARFGDNMRSVAVTEGDKVEAQIKFGWTVDYYGIGDLVKRINAVSKEQVDAKLKEYAAKYDFVANVQSGAGYDSVAYQAKIEVGLRSFLEEGGYKAFTTTFEDLYGLDQLPGLAVQNLMADGYGFGGEGDWKTSALGHVLKTLAGNKKTSFMEDYTYHFDGDNSLALGSHMLEVCPTIAEGRPRIEVHHLGIGGKENPARLVFDGAPGAGIAASLIDLGNRFRLIVAVVDAIKSPEPMPNLPVARVVWKPRPSLEVGAEAWIQAGGAHHSVYSQAVTVDQLRDWAAINRIEFVLIDEKTDSTTFAQNLKISAVAWQ